MTTHDLAHLLAVRASDDQHARAIALLTFRARLRDAHATREALEQTIAGHPGAERLRRRLRFLARIHGARPHDDFIESYRERVLRGEIDYGVAFGAPSLPLAALCELRNDDKLDAVALAGAIQERFQLFVARWQKLTGHTPDDPSGVGASNGPFAALGTLLDVKAPVPFRPRRTEALATREHAYMTRRAGGLKQGSRPIPADPASEAADVRIREPGDAAVDPCCEVDDIMRKAGAKPLAQPGPEEAQYTFPGPLDIREDVFFDYSVILPLDPCELDLPQVRTIPRELLAARLFATHARDLIADKRMSGSLGRLEAETLAVLDAVIQLPPAAPPPEIRRLRRRLRQTACAIRSTHRVFVGDLLIDAAGADSTTIEQRTDELVRAKEAAEAGILFRKRQVPSSTTERHADIIEPAGRRFPDVLPTGNDFHKAWGWHTHPPDTVHQFFDAVEDECIPKIETLLSAAGKLATAVDGFVAAADQAVGTAASQAATALPWVKDRFLARAFYRLRSELAALLDQVSEVIPLATEELEEGNARLGLQLVYRQRWIPEGYVRGKLVGFKNLPPDTEESVRRRSLVRTTRETTTFESFAATRQQDVSRTTKESAAIAREMADKNVVEISANASFTFSVSSSFGGSFGAQTASKFDLARTSRQTQELLSETTAKASNSYNEKSETKLVEQVQSEEELESVHKIRNLNKEITANYFYYQLLRQYLVTVELHEIRPVLLRSRELPTEGEIDHRFLSTHAHVLGRILPPQLAVDLLDTVDEIEPRGRVVTERVATAEDREAAYEAFRQTPVPVDTEARPTASDDWRRELEGLERMMIEARERLSDAEDSYARARVRLDRVLSHVRSNRCAYAQAIWASQSSQDQNLPLEKERFAGFPLAEVTRGLVREGYHGQEEVFTYSGPSLVLADLLAEHLIAGADIVGSMSEEELRATALFQELSRYYSDVEIDELVAKIEAHAFVLDPAAEERVLSSRRIQVAQDALVVETMPGQVPLLEAFQMAKRYLSVEHDCLNNAHLRGRIADATWKNGPDERHVHRHEGNAPGAEVEP